MTERTAVILAGGRSQRMGRDKLELVFEEETLLTRTLQAVRTCCSQIIAVGPERPSSLLSDVEHVIEKPRFSGPVAAIAAALDCVRCDEVLLLAGDLAFPQYVVRRLLDSPWRPGDRSAVDQCEAVVLMDEDGWPQFLAGRYCVKALVAAVSELESPTDCSVRRLMQGLRFSTIPVPSELVMDIDTPGVAKRLGIADQ